MAALIFDLGGTHLRCAVSADDGSIRALERSRVTSFSDGAASEQVWAGIMRTILDFSTRMEAAVNPAAPIVLSFPGPVTRDSRIINAPTVAGPDRAIPDLKNELGAASGREVYILNDLTAAAWFMQEVTPVDRFLIVTVSSGIGSKIFDRRHPDGVISDPVYAGEIGHLKVTEGDTTVRCDCGGYGHLGAIASGRGIERLARRVAAGDSDRFRQSACAQTFGGTPESLTNEGHIVPAARLGDGWAIDIIREAMRPLATTLLAAVLAVGLDQIVIIGGFAISLGATYMDILRGAIADSCDYLPLAARLEGMLLMGDPDSCLRGTAVYSRRVAPSSS